MNKHLVIAGCGLVALAVVSIYAVPYFTAPKVQTNAELLAAVMEDWPEEIPQSQLALMSEVRFTMPGFE